MFKCNIYFRIFKAIHVPETKDDILVSTNLLMSMKRHPMYIVCQASNITRTVLWTNDKTDPS